MRTLLPILLLACSLTHISCKDENPTPPAEKNKLVIEGIEYTIDYVLVETISNGDRMLEMKSYLDTAQTEIVTLYIDFDFDDSREIPAGNYTNTGTGGVKRAGFRIPGQSWVELYNPNIPSDMVTSLSINVSGTDGGKIKVKGAINYTDIGNKKVEIDYEGAYEFD
jgi:hypothetical protein